MQSCIVGRLPAVVLHARREEGGMDVENRRRKVVASIQGIPGLAPQSRDMMVPRKLHFERALGEVVVFPLTSIRPIPVRHVLLHYLGSPQYQNLG